MHFVCLFVCLLWLGGTSTTAEKRFGPYFVEPLVAGLDENNKPYVCAMDLIGAPVFTSDFVVGGTCSEQIYGMCEALYRPNMVPLSFPPFLLDVGPVLMTFGDVCVCVCGVCVVGVVAAAAVSSQEPEDLFETISQALLASVDRDCLAGWGAVVHIITPEGITTRKLKSRQD